MAYQLVLYILPPSLKAVLQQAVSHNYVDVGEALEKCQPDDLRWLAEMGLATIAPDNWETAGEGWMFLTGHGRQTLQQMGLLD